MNYIDRFKNSDLFSEDYKNDTEYVINKLEELHEQTDKEELSNKKQAMNNEVVLLRNDLGISFC